MTLKSLDRILDCILDRILDRILDPRVLGSKLGFRGLCKASKALVLGLQMQPGVLGRQMPPRGIGASNATLVL